MPSGLNFDSFLTLAAPYLPFDGMNEQGVAIDLLSEIGVMDGDTDKLQWSVIYNLTNGNGQIFAHRNTKNIIKFYLKTYK